MLSRRVRPLAGHSKFLAHFSLSHHKNYPTVSSAICNIPCISLIEIVVRSGMKNSMFVTPGVSEFYNVPKMASLALGL
jgi:hypothetical protein